MRVIERGYIFVGTPAGIMAITVEVFESGVGGYLLPGESVTLLEVNAIAKAMKAYGYSDKTELHDLGFIRTVTPPTWDTNDLLNDVENAVGAVLKGAPNGH